MVQPRGRGLPGGAAEGDRLVDLANPAARNRGGRGGAVGRAACPNGRTAGRGSRSGSARGSRLRGTRDRAPRRGSPRPVRASRARRRRWKRPSRRWPGRARRCAGRRSRRTVGPGPGRPWPWRSPRWRRGWRHRRRSRPRRPRPGCRGKPGRFAASSRATIRAVIPRLTHDAPPSHRARRRSGREVGRIADQGQVETAERGQHDPEMPAHVRMPQSPGPPPEPDGSAPRGDSRIAAAERRFLAQEHRLRGDVAEVKQILAHRIEHARDQPACLSRWAKAAQAMAA